MKKSYFMKSLDIMKIAMAILFFGCLLKMPYGYYQFVRFIGLIGFVILSYDAFNRHMINEAFLYGALALLFQPIFKISLGRDLWNIVDVVVGIALMISVFYKKLSKVKT